MDEIECDPCFETIQLNSTFYSRQNKKTSSLIDVNTGKHKCK
jgi:hypothetical protein